MLFLLSIAYASQHPTDSLPVSSSDFSGIHIIIGGDISGELSGSINNTGTLQSVTFQDDGQQADAIANDNIFSASVTVAEQQHDSMLQITNNGRTIWSGTVFGEQGCQQTIVKMMLTTDTPAVKIHSCSSETNTKNTNTSTHSTPSRVTAFYNNETFIQSISGLIFLSVGILVGINIRRRRSLPLEYLSTPQNTVFGISRGQKLCWQVPEELRLPTINKLANDLSILGPVLLLTTPQQRKQVAAASIHGVFINQLDIPTLSDLHDSIDHLRNYGSPIVLVSSLNALPEPIAQQNTGDVLLDFMHQMAGSITCIALVDEQTSLSINHTVTDINDIYATAEFQTQK